MKAGSTGRSWRRFWLSQGGRHERDQHLRWQSSASTRNAGDRSAHENNGLGDLKFKGGLTSPFGDLYSGSTLDGLTISQVVQLANVALSKKNATVDYSALNTLIDNLNKSFGDGIVSGWAYTYLTE